jgi:hypothetical protein
MICSAVERFELSNGESAEDAVVSSLFLEAMTGASREHTLDLLFPPQRVRTL